jgi:hypothetical protein
MWSNNTLQDDLLSGDQENQQKTKHFYFQEIDQIIVFPNCGNQGKYVTYKIQLKSKEKAKQIGDSAALGEFLESEKVDRNYPHTVGYYKDFSGEGVSFKPEYLELRKIRFVEEFWLFLNACNI